MNAESNASSRAPSFVSRLGLKLGGLVGFLAALAGLVVPGVPAGAAAGAGLVLGAVAYGAVHYWVHRRLRHIQSTLQKIRRHAFDDLTPPSSPAGDELSRVLWEVYRTGQSLENEIQELKEMESYRREFIGNVSHELKTPIFSVQGFTETLLNGALTDESVNRTFLEKIQHNVNRLENLARDLSAITKIETGEMEMSRDSFDLSEVFQETIDSLEIRAAEEDVTLRQEVAPNLPSVFGDRDRIQRVIVNLADNAIKYNEEGGTVTLHARPTSGDEVEVRVVDDGIGIPSQHLPRLTERFYRVDKSRSRNQGGTGLGLAIVKHILGAHDQSLMVESTPGEGSTFSFTLTTAAHSSLPAAKSV